MAVVSANVLKSYFETGDKPTQAQFSDLIDSFLPASAGLGDLSNVSALVSPIDGQNYTLKWVAAESNYTLAPVVSGGGGGASTLDDLTDVVITGASAGDFFTYNGSNWVNINPISARALLQAQASAAKLSALADLDNAQGIVVQTGASTFSKRSLVAGTNITITDTVGSAGDITIAVTNPSAAVTAFFSINDLTDVSIATPSSGQTLQYRGGEWVNVTAAPTSAIVTALFSLDDITNVSAPSPTNNQILTWQNATSQWVAASAVPSSATVTAPFALDDITNVSAPSPTNGQVLTWQNATSQWVAASVAAGGGTTALDDLTDVVIASVADNDFLVYVSASGGWINASASRARVLIGAGTVSGKTSSTDNAVVRWDGTSGDTLQNSGVLIDDSNNMVLPGALRMATNQDINLGAGGDINVSGTGNINFDTGGINFNVNAAGLTFGNDSNIIDAGTGGSLSLGLNSTFVLGGGSSLTVKGSAAIRTDTTVASYFVVQARDVDGAAWTTFITVSAGNTPECNLSDNVTKAGQYIYRAGGTDVTLPDGGTGASDAVGARVNLGAQTADATLSALAAFNTNGFIVQTAADTFAGRSLAAGKNITIADNIGSAANPTIGWVSAVSDFNERETLLGNISNAVSITRSMGQYIRITLTTASCNVVLPTLPVSGEVFQLLAEIKQDGSGNRNAFWRVDGGGGCNLGWCNQYAFNCGR